MAVEKPDHTAWSEEMTRSVMAQVKRHREALGLRAQDVSDRAAALGVNLPRGVIAKLESGERRQITLPEFIAMSAALEVPLPLLLAPIDMGAEVEVLPGFRRPADVAYRIFSGEAWSQSDPAWRTAERDRFIVRTNRMLQRYAEHRQLLSRISVQSGGLMVHVIKGRGADSKGDKSRGDAEHAQWQAQRQVILEDWDRLMKLREDMEYEEWVPPALPAHLQSNLEIGCGLAAGTLATRRQEVAVDAPGME